jgi:DNA-3-methyladenine glycosylase II
MFLIFILFKKNIFSKGDLALINSIKINYQINELSEIKLDEIVSKWSPFKTIASLLLWKSIEEKIYSID